MKQEDVQFVSSLLQRASGEGEGDPGGASREESRDPEEPGQQDGRPVNRRRRQQQGDASFIIATVFLLAAGDRERLITVSVGVC